jgi:acyl carrier protein
LPVFDELRSILARVAKKREQDITVDMPLANLGLDSLNWVQAIVGIESAFDIEVDIEKLKTFKTVGDLLNHVEECAKYRSV